MYICKKIIYGKSIMTFYAVLPMFCSPEPFLTLPKLYIRTGN